MTEDRTEAQLVVVADPNETLGRSRLHAVATAASEADAIDDVDGDVFVIRESFRQLSQAQQSADESEQLLVSFTADVNDLSSFYIAELRDDAPDELNIVAAGYETADEAADEIAPLTCQRCGRFNAYGDGGDDVLCEDCKDLVEDEDDDTFDDDLYPDAVDGDL